MSVLKDVDPMSTSLIFNCGMGVVRSESCPTHHTPQPDVSATFAMCAALLVRRKQVLSAGLDDPFPSGAGASGLATVRQCTLIR